MRGSLPRRNRTIGAATSRATANGRAGSPSSGACTGAVGSEHFARLSEGQHPHTEEQLVRHQVSRTYEGKFGREVTSAEHRAGWDATFSAPKSVSLTALVGGDERVREAHRESVRMALRELERYTQARIGNVHAPETTGKFIAATFEHDTARPVDGYAAPQLHTHAVIFNMYRAGERPNTRFAAARDVCVTALRHGDLPIRTGAASGKAGLRIRARQAWAAGNPGLHEGVFGGFQPAPGTDQRSSAGARHRRSGSGSDRGPPYARPQGTAFA
jgi:hypothetical protein